MYAFIIKKNQKSVHHLIFNCLERPHFKNFQELYKKVRRYCNEYRRKSRETQQEI